MVKTDLFDKVHDCCCINNSVIRSLSCMKMWGLHFQTINTG